MTTTDNHRSGRYNVTLSRLMELLVQMSEDEHQVLLEKAEKIVRIKQRSEDGPPAGEVEFHNERRYPRKPCSLIVNFSVGSRYHTSTIENVSVDGAFILTSATFDTGEAVSLAFSYPDFPDVFRIQGVIRRVTRRGIGVQFEGLSQTQQNRIKALLDWMKGHAI